MGQKPAHICCACLAAALGLCVIAFALDMLGLFYGHGGVGNMAVLSMPVELLAMGLVCYTLGKLTTRLAFPLLIAGVCVAGELFFINISRIQPLGLVSLCAFLLLLPIVGVVGFKMGMDSLLSADLG